MAELKHIGEVEQVVEVQENDNLIGERDGRAVRIPTNKVIPEGMVKSVNGNTPDSEGNVDLPTTIPSVQTAQVGQTVVVKAVDENGKPTEWEAKDAGSQVDWNEADETKTSFVKNRTHWAETEYSIQWDENLESHATVDVSALIPGLIFVHVSDDVLTMEDIIGSTVMFTDGQIDGTIVLDESQITISDDGLITVGMAMPIAVISPADNYIAEGAAFELPKKGVYLCYIPNELIVHSIIKETVHKIDPKFIPNVGGVLWMSDSFDSARYWDSSIGDWKPLSVDDFKKAFASGVIRTGMSGPYGEGPTGTIIGYHINDSDSRITYIENTYLYSQTPSIQSVAINFGE